MIVVALKVHGLRCSPYFVLLVSSCADRSCILTLPEPGDGFGLHLTAVPGYETTGVLSIEGIEEIFTFDWFMDCNVEFFTSSLGPHKERLSTENWSGLLPSRSQRQVPTLRKNHKAVETQFLDEPVLYTLGDSLKLLAAELGIRRP